MLVVGLCVLVSLGRTHVQQNDADGALEVPQPLLVAPGDAGLERVGGLHQRRALRAGCWPLHFGQPGEELFFN